MRTETIHRQPVPGARTSQRGVTLMGLMFWAIVTAFAALLALKVFPTVNEYWAIQKAVNKVAQKGGSNVLEIRTAFDRQKDVEFAINSLSGKDLEITKVNDKVVVSFSYAKEVPLFGPAFLLIKYKGQSQ